MNLVLQTLESKRHRIKRKAGNYTVNRVYATKNGGWTDLLNNQWQIYVGMPLEKLNTFVFLQRWEIQTGKHAGQAILRGPCCRPIQSGLRVFSFTNRDSE